MTTDSETTEQYLTFVWSKFLISVLVFVSHDFKLGRVSVQFANALITFARWRRHLESTTVTYRTAVASSERRRHLANVIAIKAFAN